jgi:hypothetical protein
MATFSSPGRTPRRVLVACYVISIVFIAFWFVGQEASADPTLDPPEILVRLYPGTWPPVARGVLWLFVGATAVVFNLTTMFPRAHTRAARIGVGVSTAITGACFVAFAIGSFAGADWSVIH